MQRDCRQCGVPLPAEVAECPRCLLGLGVELSAGARATPERIGAYRVLGKIGSGGMADVYEAEQSNPPRRVALKVVRGGPRTSELQIQMLDLEARSLARLRHDGIAAIYESGATDDGLHFFAMELAQGRTLAELLEDQPSPRTPEEIDHRIRLFLKIADALQYAHQRGVIHRDLKPANIVVDESASEVKILDFGLARWVDDENVSKLTEVGTIKGTLPYMSPEQTRGVSAEIDIRTDVYSMGVILYEMLAGRRPYDVDHQHVPAALKIICEQSPRPLRADSAVRKLIDRDLARIVSKALEKEPDRRYDGAAALAADVRRFRAGQPILARPPSTIYQLRKLVQRNRLASSLTAATLAMILGFAIWMSLLYRQSQANLQRALDAEETASTEARTATQVADYLVELIRSADPYKTAEEPTVRDMLEQALVQLDTELVDQPALQARMLHVLGRTFAGVGQEERSLRLLHRALDVVVVVPSEAALQAKIHTMLGWVYTGGGDLERARHHTELAIQTTLEHLGETDPNLPHLYGNLSYIATLEGRVAEAEDLALRGLEMMRALPDVDDGSIARAISIHADAQRAAGDLESALQTYRDSLPLIARSVGARHTTMGAPQVAIATVLAELGRHDEAVPHARTAVEIFDETLPPAAGRRSDSYVVYARCLAGAGSLEEAGHYLRLARDAGHVDSALGELPEFRELRRDPELAEVISDLVNGPQAVAEPPAG